MQQRREGHPSRLSIQKYRYWIVTLIVKGTDTWFPFP
jgi:hypothetical protein